MINFKRGIFMETNEKVKRINPLFAIGYICLPIAVYLIISALAVALVHNSGVGTIVIIIGAALVVLWFSVLGRKFYKSKVKQFESELGNMNFKRNQTFNGKGETVIVDIADGKVAVIFFWNPFKKYIVSASKIEKAWVEDGRTGSGMLEGSQRVRFCFILDGARINVNTFISNNRYKMTDNYILDGISKADLMVEVLNNAKANALGTGAN